MLITNFKKLANNPLRQKALLIAEAGYQAIEIGRVVSERINLKNQILEIKHSPSYENTKSYESTKINLDDFKRVFLIGIGKGSALASIALAKILGKKLTKGIALDIQNLKLKIENLKLKILTGTHPLPSTQNIKASQAIIKLAQGLKKDDLLITFICGGGSALACASKAELIASQTVFKELTKKGADIVELNTVRKHLSEVKGGGLAKIAYPATVISLIVSDVLRNNISMVASGPTVFDKTTKKDAIKIIKKYLPQSAYQSTLIRALKETPKDKKYFKKVKNILFLSNREPILAMAKKAKELGLRPRIYSLKVQGEAKNSLIPLIKAVKSKEALLAAGETTVTLDNRPVGKGGRNTEAVLGAISKAQIAKRKSLDAKRLALSDKLVIMAFASDSRDNTEAAGALADFSTFQKIKKLNLNPQEYLDNNNSFNFFKKTGDLIFVKQKSFNVSDLMLILKE